MIGIWAMSNNLAVGLVSLDPVEETAVIRPLGVEDMTDETVKVIYNDEGLLCVEWGELELPFKECMKV